MEDAVKLCSQVFTAQSFQVNIRILCIILQVIYHRFYKNCLFSPLGLYNTATDQNVDTTWRNPIHFILRFARGLPGGLPDFLENFTKSGVSVRKNPAVHLLNTPKLTCSISVNSRRCCLFALNYKGNVAMDLFQQVLFGRSLTLAAGVFCICIELSGV